MEFLYSGQAFYSSLLNVNSQYTINYTTVTSCGMNSKNAQATIIAQNSLIDFDYLNLSRCFSTFYSALAIQTLYSLTSFNLRYSQLEHLESQNMSCMISNPFGYGYSKFECCNIINNSHIDPINSLFTFWCDVDFISCVILDNQGTFLLTTNNYYIALLNCTFIASEFVPKMIYVMIKSPQYTESFVNKIDFLSTAFCEFSYISLAYPASTPINTPLPTIQIFIPLPTTPIFTPMPSDTPLPTRTLHPTSTPRRTSLFNNDNASPGSVSISSSTIFAISIAAFCAVLIISVGTFCLIYYMRSNDNDYSDEEYSSSYTSEDISSINFYDTDV